MERARVGMSQGEVVEGVPRCKRHYRPLHSDIPVDFVTNIVTIMRGMLFKEEKKLTQIGRRFGLSDQAGSGIFCDENGVFVGAVPLLERSGSPPGRNQWRPRTVPDLNRELSECYGLPVEVDRKIDNLRSVARALGLGDLILAQIATLHLELPNPPLMTKSARGWDGIIDLANQLRASDLLKADWNPAKHPRWPAGSPGSIGGEFAPVGMAFGDSAAEEQNVSSDTTTERSAPVVPVQITIPAPFELPGGIPFPSEIVPPPVIPNINPRDLPRNPYPDRAGCDEEWAEAIAYCKGLLERNQLGRGDYRGSGKSLYQCIMGQVSERCGGNNTGA